MKKPTRLRATRQTDVRLKVWKAGTLRREDWDFARLTDFPKAQLQTALLWEIERELRSGKWPYLVAWEFHEIQQGNAKLKAHLDGTKPLSKEDYAALLPERPPKTLEQSESDLKKLTAHIRAIEGKPGGQLLSEEELERLCPAWKAPTPTDPKPILKSYTFDELAKDIQPGQAWLYGSASYTTIHALEIEWSLTESTLVEGFRNWLRQNINPFSTSYHACESKIGKRKTAGALAHLRELSIYRISEAGFTRSQGLKMLGIQRMSAPNWAHAKSKTRARISERLRDCKSTAWNVHKHAPQESSDWRDYFVEPFSL